MKNSEEVQVEFNDSISLKQIIKIAQKKLGGNPNTAKLYNKSGVLLFEEDVSLLAPNDILYIALQGENFNYCAILDDYDLGRTLGVGGFGKVILAKHKETKQQVAIKFTDVGAELSSANQISSIYKEAESLKALIHKNIVQLYHAFIEGKQFIMIMEAAMGGELLEYLKKVDKMNEKNARFILLQVVQAILYCHSRGVVHRDLKLENVLFKNQNFEDDWIVKVVDFGIAGVGGDKVDAGTLAYMAPECLEKQAAETTPAIDVWAIGVMYYAMIFGALPFSSQSEKDLIKQIKNDKVVFPRDIAITPEGKDLIQRMLTKDPKQRLELLDFVDLPYALWEEEEFDQHLKVTLEEFEKQRQKQAEDEEAKMQEKFLAQLDLKEEEKKESKGHSKKAHTGKGDESTKNKNKGVRRKTINPK